MEPTSSVGGSERNQALCRAARVHSAWGLNYGETKLSPH